MGIICRLIGSRISHTAEAIQRHRSISKGSISPTAPGTPVKYITAGNDEYIVTNREAAHTLVQGGYAGYAELPPTAPAHFECAELPNSTVHHECSELPAVPIHEAYAELPASGPPEKSAELPGTPCQASTTQRTVLKEKQKEESFKSEIGSNGHGDLHYSDRLHHGIEPNVAFDQRDVTAHGSGLPTYSESEFTPAARFDAPTIHQVEEFNDQQSGNTARVPVQMTAPGSGPGYSFQRLAHPVILPQQKPGVVDEGFVRAYAPELADCGINQEMFMSFHEDLFQTSMVSWPVLGLVNQG
ncbi:hypothetical protein N7492_008606 [Penicillium capsulatum]|uniref:Uncharacterized protein n=1 Tax=Penicillium capsulatum TaxID=69766 RepID=A0A9W9LH34_9EURO|nr:hypothetical protein N7492_008606 [Penicillium capsulatum]KAJ6106011.1 hypothetical protein N7512_009528 [Penicillium capsulatum]